MEGTTERKGGGGAEGTTEGKGGCRGDDWGEGDAEGTTVVIIPFSSLISFLSFDYLRRSLHYPVTLWKINNQRSNLPPSPHIRQHQRVLSPHTQSITPPTAIKVQL